MNKAVGETWEKLRLAATELFAEMGYNGTSVRSICDKAGANIGAVNYHFGSKQGLYEVVVRDMFTDLTGAVKDLHITPSDQESWEKALTVWVHSFLSLLLSKRAPDKWLGQLCARELTDPSQVSNFLFQNFFKPVSSELRRMIQMGLTPEHTKAEEQYFVISVLSQCLMMCNRRAPWDHIIIPVEIPINQWIEEYGQHVVRSITSQLSFRGNPFYRA